jgi:flagellar basal-body rod protein FlgF
MNLVSSLAAARLTAQERAMDVLADNIANASTPGYKSERVQFSDWLSRQANATITYPQDRATWRDTQAGTLSRTGNTLDLAMTGNGWFTVNTPQGPRLTRDGRFELLPSGTIADGAGNAVLDNNGQPIQLGPTDTQISIAGDGTVSSENGQLGKIGAVSVDPMQIIGEGSTLFRATAPTTPVASPGMVQGAIEDSNVQPVLEMSHMMSSLREYQFMSQFIQAEADRQQSAIDKLLPTNSSGS